MPLLRTRKTPRLQFGWHIDIHIQGFRDDDLPGRVVWGFKWQIGQSLVTDLDVFTNHFCSKLSDLPKVPQKKMPPYTQQPTRPSAHLAGACQQRSKAQAVAWMIEGFVFSQTLRTKENDVDLYLNETWGKSGKVEFQLFKLEDSNKSSLSWVWTRPRLRYLSNNIWWVISYQLYQCPKNLVPRNSHGILRLETSSGPQPSGHQCHEKISQHGI